MIATIVISVLTSLGLLSSILFLPKIKTKRFEFNTFWLVCLLGAGLILLCNCVTLDDVKSGLFENSSINPIKILILFFSMTFLSIFLDEVGMFRYLAAFLVKKFKVNQFLLFITMYLMVAVLTIFTSNDIVILTFTPFICYFCKNAKISPLPYLIAEFVAANLYSMILIIGNPTNIYLAGSSNIDFISYLQVMTIPTIVSGLVQFGLILLLFRKSLKTKIEVEEAKVKITSKIDMLFGLIHLIICLFLLIISSYIALDMWLICILCATSLLIFIISIHLIRGKNLTIVKDTAKRLPFNLIPFIISMFIIVLALKKHGVTNLVFNLFGDENVILKYGATSFVASNLINNIPMSVLYSNIIQFTDPSLQNKAIYSTIIGSNLGAFLTPVGALAGIMFTDLVHKQGLKFSFKSFVLYGSLISIPTLIVALGMLSIVFIFI